MKKEIELHEMMNLAISPSRRGMTHEPPMVAAGMSGEESVVPKQVKEKR